MKTPILIYGAGGLGREVLSMLSASPEFTARGFIDDVLAVGQEIAGLKVLGGRELLTTSQEKIHVILAIGNPLEKAKLIRELTTQNVIFSSIIHHTAILQDEGTIRIGRGTVIAAGCILTTDISIGNHVLVNLNTTIGHDVNIGDGSSVMTGVNIAGGVTIGNAVLVGSGSNIMNGVRIGDRARIGMGSVVTRDVEPDTTVVGVPAKPMKR